MKPLFALALFVGHLSASAQWDLVTPIKTRSEFTALHMVSDAVGFAVDRPMGAILRTSDGGFHWERMMNNSTNNPIGMHVWDDQRAIVVGESGSVYRTTDAFTTITGTSNVLFGHFNCVFFVNDTLGWAGTGAGRVYRSTDAGATWTLMDSGLGASNDIHAIQFLDTQTGYLTCAGGGTVRKSTDGGLTWQESWGGANTTFLDMHFYDESTGVCVGLPNIVVRTTDGGLSWDSIPSNSTYIMNSLAAQGDTLVACGWWGRTIRSTDAGLTWTEIQVGSSEHRSVAITPNGAGLLGTDGRIQRTNDMGLTWAVTNDGTWHTRLNKVSFMDADTGVAIGWATMGGFEAGLLRTTDGGRHWEKAGGGGLGVHLTPAGEGCLGGSNGAFARTLNGFNERILGNGPLIAIRCTWTLGAGTHLVGGGYVNGGIYRTTNNGQTWTRVLDAGNITISDLWFVNDQQGYAVGEYGDNYRTLDGGLTWQPLPAMSGSHTVFFLNEQLGWTQNHRTTDGGGTWTVMGGTPQNTMSIFFTDADTGYAVGYTAQTVRTVDGGITWENFLPEILNASVGDAAFVDGSIVVACNNGDIFRAFVSCPAQAMVPTITADGDVLCVNTAGSAQWYLDSEPIADGDSLCLTTIGPGSYQVVVTETTGCVSAPSAPHVVISTGLGVAEAQGAARLYPNPANDRLRIEPGHMLPTNVVLVDAQGRIVREDRINGGGTIDVSALPAGLYVVRLVSGQEVAGLRFLKE
ncbi:MAG TPA: YCF48-related protein [Flavobacteriales bacterium]